MTKNEFIRAMLFDISFTLALISYGLLILTFAGALTGASYINLDDKILIFTMVLLIIFTGYLASKKARLIFGAKWIAYQTIYILGGFIVSYVIEHRKSLVYK